MTITARQQIKKVRGDTWTMRFTIQETDDETDETTAFDLTGATVRATVGTWTGDVGDGGVIVTDAATGKLTVRVPAAATALFRTGGQAGGPYLADVEITTTGGDVLTPVVYEVMVLPDASV